MSTYFKWYVIHTENTFNGVYYTVQLVKKRWYGWQVIKTSEGNDLATIKETFDNLVELLNSTNNKFCK